MRSRLSRTGLWLLVAVAIVASALYTLQPKPILVDVAVVQRGPLSVFIQDDGITRIRERYVVSSPLTGRLLRISYDVGDTVTAAETVLGRMQPTDPELLDPRALAQAQARVSAAERRLQATRAELTKAETALNFAEMELGRLQRLRSTAAVSQGEFDVAELAFRSKQEEVRAAGFNVEIAEYELQQQKAALLLTDPDRRAVETPLVTAEVDRVERDAVSDESATDPAEDDVNSEMDMELAILAPINGRMDRPIKHVPLTLHGIRSA